MKVTAIIPCYWADGELVDMTLRCIESLRRTAPSVQWLIVDDGSPLPFEEEVPSIYQRSKNGGYAAAVNDGLETVDGDVIVIANNDLVFHDGWLCGLLSVLDEGFDVATCWTSDQDYKLEPLIREGGKFGSLFAMKREVYETLGGFDEQFRGYFSDLDYRRRALDAGFRIGMNYGLVVQHEAKATYRKTDPDDEEYLRSMRLYEAKWGVME